MLTKEQDSALNILAKRLDKHIDSWNIYVLGYWICAFCGDPFVDHEEHGFIHLKEFNLAVFA